ncbi:MAG TPA: KH domain-containing protein [Candidatus Norongarragalinales archaeon]|nr:KH domain-containing protein [Candidatus Norongarragalinales archaeon]
MRLVTLSRKTINALKKDNGALKKAVSQRCAVKLELEDDDVIVEGQGGGGEEWVAEQVLKAIGFGFEPKIAYKLLEDQYFLDEVDLEAAFRGNEKKMLQYKARVIGQGGMAKKKLQELSGAFLAVSDRQVAIIGEYEEIRSAKEAILRLLEGAEHNGVYAFLEKQRQKNRWL